MVVYLIPISSRGYQLYVEMPPEAVESSAGSTQSGWLGRWTAQFRATLAEAEMERVRRERGEDSGRRGLWRAVMAKIATTIAEQRLLWHLRHETAVDVFHPDDRDADAAIAEVRRQLGDDAVRHRWWTIVDGVAAAITGPLLFLVPGPNVVGLYFTFRAVGHFFSWRGARRGLDVVAWRPVGSAELTNVRGALELPPDLRRHRLDEIGHSLGLQHVTGFIERVLPGRS